MYAKKYRKIFFTLALSLPSLASAQGILPDCAGPDCNFSHFVELAQNILNFLIKAVAMGSVLVFAWAGFKYMTARGDRGKVQSAHDIFLHVATGLILTLVAWLIISALLSVLTGKGLNEHLNDAGITKVDNLLDTA